MQNLAPSEEGMWVRPIRSSAAKVSDEEINSKYATRELRIVTESNREQLPNFVEALRRPGWMDLRPFYQRRPRWETWRQSRLIESFIMNVPVPPLFVYESGLARYEVMDGQQRITAVREFYSNRFKLEGLEQWPELNGRVYETLPSEIKKGLDRRSISYIVLLKESAETSEEEALLRQQVFERLNTGGVKLSNQEIRNSLYHGRFNDLLLESARDPLFREAWHIPLYSESENLFLSDDLAENRPYLMMRDVENVLRFFALRHVEHYLRTLFKQTVKLAADLYGSLLFRPWIPEPPPGKWADKPQVAFADSVMVGLSQNIEHSEVLISRRERLIDETKRLFGAYPAGTFTGRGNTKQDVLDRTSFYGDMLRRVISE